MSWTSVCVGLSFCLQADALPGEVQLWEEDLVLPAYRLGSPEPSPMFYRGESYQGAQKRVYPYPLQDGITGEKGEETFRAVYLENEYVKLCVLPEIGGRLLYATDKTNGYDFFYRQHVIKPALIGMLGAWISGGIEWCVFHHHRNTTHLPVDYALQVNADGSKTIWIGEVERRHRMRWQIGMTLHPGKSYLEVEVRMINRTPLPHSILYWANVAVAVDDQYQVIFPPSVQVATYHAKNDFVHWPLGRGPYLGADYAGVDLSWWKNHPRQVSCFAWDLREDFMGGYDHGRQAGVVHVGDHHVVCGAKLWEWAPGSIWDTQVLTDSDGPYAELMVGAYSDNQPAYSWIKPMEVKQFTQYWYPVREIGGFKQANLNGALNLEIEGKRARLGACVTTRHQNARLELRQDDSLVMDAKVDLDPARPFVGEVELSGPGTPESCRLRLLDAEGRLLVEYQPTPTNEVPELPEPVQPPPSPQSIESIEELYFTGLRVEQIHSPSVNPTSYYLEALKRDPDDVRCNIQMGIHYNRRGLTAEAERHLRRAVARTTANYTRAKDTEAHYQLGLTWKAMGNFAEAEDAFHRAAWDSAYHAPAYYQLATLACRRGDFARAAQLLGNALTTNQRNPRIQNLRRSVLARLHPVSPKALVRSLSDALERDPLDRWVQNELRVWGQGSERPVSIPGLSLVDSGDLQMWMELVTDYMDVGLNDEALELLHWLEGESSRQMQLSSLTAYYLAYLYRLKGEETSAAAWLDAATRREPALCFPFRLETVNVLEAALEAEPNNGRTHYYLGNCLYELQPQRAIGHWQRACELEPSLAMAHRNLGWANARYQGDIPKAIASYERAVASDSAVARTYLELDDLYEQANTRTATRLEMLRRSPGVVASRKDLLIRQIRLMVVEGAYDEAVGLLTGSQFFISEGGGDELGDANVDAHLLRGLEMLLEGAVGKARQLFVAASAFPENLSQESIRPDDRLSQIYYYLGCAEKAAGNTQGAHESWRQATEVKTSRSPETQYYQALALRELGEGERADAVAEGLYELAKRALGGNGEDDFFAKFGERTSRQAQRAENHYVRGLSLLARGEADLAARHFEQALTLNQAQVWAAWQLRQVRSTP